MTWFSIRSSSRPTDPGRCPIIPMDRREQAILDQLRRQRDAAQPKGKPA